MVETSTILMLNYSEKCDFVNGSLSVLVCGLDDFEGYMLISSTRDAKNVSPLSLAASRGMWVETGGEWKVVVSKSKD